MKAIYFALFLCFGFQAAAIEPVRIEHAANYDHYTNDELRRRVWQLERAVAQLQDQVFQLAVREGNSESGSNPWTCRMDAFGTTYVAAGNTRASALAQVIKKCSDGSNAIHCPDSNAKCDNQ